MRFEKRSLRDSIAVHIGLTQRRFESFDIFGGKSRPTRDGGWADADAGPAAFVASGSLSRGDINDRPARMRATFRPSGFEQMSVAVAQLSPEYPSGSRGHRALQLRHPAAGRPRTSHPGPAQQSSDPDSVWVHPIAAAMSWAMGQIIEGFALSVATAHPGFMSLRSEHLDRDATAGDLPRGPHAADGHRSQAFGRPQERLGTEPGAATFHPLPRLRQGQPTANDAVKSGASMRFEAASIDLPSWGAWAASLPVKLWSRMLREREIRRMSAEVEALDDRMLKDIGLSRCEINLVVRDGRHR